MSIKMLINIFKVLDQGHTCFLRLYWICQAVWVSGYSDSPDYKMVTSCYGYLLQGYNKILVYWLTLCLSRSLWFSHGWITVTALDNDCWLDYLVGPSLTTPQTVFSMAWIYITHQSLQATGIRIKKRGRVGQIKTFELSFLVQCYLYVACWWIMVLCRLTFHWSI